MGDKINQLRSVVEGNSGILAQLLPLIQNIQQELKELRRDTNITPAPAVPLSPEKPAPSTQLVVVTPEKHGDQGQGSHSLISDQEEVEEETIEVEKENEKTHIEEPVDKEKENEETHVEEAVNKEKEMMRMKTKPLRRRLKNRLRWIENSLTRKIII